jgi:type IV pilus assembly protein PilC
MVYPIGIIVVSMVVLGVIFMFVVPGFKKIFDSLGGTLPLPTQILIMVSDFSKKYFFYVVGGLIVFSFLAKRLIKTGRGLQIVEKIRSKTPLIGKLYQKTVMARFTKTLAILVKSGVPILNALQIAGSTSGSGILEKRINGISDQVSRGNKLADTMKESGLFPSMVVSMVGVGEEGGDLSGMLEKVSNIYEDEVSAAVSGLVSLLEPAIIIFLGVVIGGIAICLFLPILKIPQLISQ